MTIINLRLLRQVSTSALATATRIHVNLFLQPRTDTTILKHLFSCQCVGTQVFVQERRPCTCCSLWHDNGLNGSVGSFASFCRGASPWWLLDGGRSGRSACHFCFLGPCPFSSKTSACRLDSTRSTWVNSSLGDAQSETHWTFYAQLSRGGRVRSTTLKVGKRRRNRKNFIRRKIHIIYSI